MEKIEHLLEKVLSYSPRANIDLIKKAYVFSREAHFSQTRVEGSPYIQHPISVAAILADMKLDTATIAAGLLHDTIEDTGMTAEDIKAEFGAEIAFLVDAVTKLSKVEFKTREEAQAENFLLKSQVIELFQHLDRVGDGSVVCLDVKHGLPFKVAIEQAA